ncbi:hypothetical protein [Mahella australiensis]|uniref:Uncharacterized protein n=1 Tax=Mahella australiensis (strain DSM 15567 / CIP 107919 / 50-1 BON) TaxID=697281 RepID=F3ZWL2_MAHA5|nr:hypothetical protein [Mahella australiensis]AEE95447.1 hypothetical protein Mahau_0229 [Mahella australiensis 50-1 BON]
MHFKKTHACHLMRLSAAMMAALLVLALFPASTYAAGATISPDTINESVITGGSTITITLDSNSWALDSGSTKTAKCNALVNAMTTGSESQELNKIKDALRNNPDAFNASGQALTITLPAVSGYDIKYDQTITVNIPSSLLANSSDLVSIPPALTVKAESEAFISGTATAAGEADIVRGGRRLSISLNNGSWHDIVYATTNREALFDCLTASSQSGEWDKVKAALKAADPASTLDVSSDGKTATITLPAVPEYNISGAQTITLDTAALASLVTVDGTLKDSQPSFTITPSDTTAQLSGTALSASESDIKAGGRTLVIALTDNHWAGDIASSKAKRDALFDSITARSEQTEWVKVTNALKAAGPAALALSDGNKKLTITLPAVTNYNITANQTVNISILPTLLEYSYRLDTMSFIITADKALSLTGTALSADESAIASGGKTIILTLTNAKWAGDIATSRSKREMLLDKFTAGGSAWQEVIDAVKAQGTVARNSDTKLTVTLPAVPAFNISSDMAVDFAGISVGDGLTDAAIPAVHDAFIIKAVTGQTAAISGTILSKTSEIDIARGGKIIRVTLKGDAWAPDIESNATKRAQLLSGFTETPSSSAWDSVIAGATVRLVNSSTIDITLPAKSDFDISSDMSVQLSIDSSLLTTSNTDITASPTFTIYAVSAALSGTVLTGVFDAPTVQKGGKTIIITLNNASWVSDAVSDSANLNTLLNGFYGAAWAPIKEILLTNPKNITLKGNQITIKLPPVPGYNMSGQVTLTIPKELINGANSNVSATPAINIGASTTASISPAAVPEDGITAGSAAINITLANNTWAADTASNKQKAGALTKGLSASSQSDQWKKVQSALSSANPSDIITLSADKRTLTLRFPAVTGYDIAQDQVISLVIPKTALAVANADINAGNFTITGNAPSATVSLEDAINDGTLAGWLDSMPTTSIYIVVPAKHIYTIDIAHTSFGTAYITDITVTTGNAVSSVVITAGGAERTLSDYRISGDKRIFNAGFMGLQKGADIIINALDSSGSSIQSPIVKKLADGQTSYNEVPKNALSGSYTLHTLLNDSKLLNSMLQYYSLADLHIGISGQ